MRSSVSKLACLATLISGFWVEPSFASSSKKDGIWWNVIPNWDHGNSTVCVSEQYNSYALIAKFDVEPADGMGWKKRARGRVTVTIRPYTFHRVFSWIPGAKHPLNCELIGWQRRGLWHNVRR